VVKSFAREEAETGQFHALNLEYVRRNIGLIRLWGAFYPLMSALIGLSSVALLWYGGRAVMTGVLSLGEFVAVLGYLALLTWPTIAIGWVINILQRGAASMGRMIEISGIKPQIEEAEPTELPVNRRGAVEIRNLTFQYPNADRPALHEIDVAIAAGETLGIVGATGSGKSTLLNLLPRLYDPPCGTVHIDGVDVRRWPLAELRRSIACVPQDTFLFSATIAGNVAFGVGGDPKPEEIEWAARMAHLAEDVSSFPQAYQTLVGERGITLSGGQKQRVSLARALIASPKILILDDALSSVDTYTEERILENLAESTRGMTRIIVSHRVSTVKGAHQIVVLKNGRIVERGDHASLMALGGAYADLYQRQLLEEELAAV
jgi:ATP-binding cassette subfamily B multidrug efflux pump